MKKSKRKNIAAIVLYALCIAVCLCALVFYRSRFSTPMCVVLVIGIACLALCLSDRVRALRAMKQDPPADGTDSRTE